MLVQPIEKFKPFFFVRVVATKKLLSAIAQQYCPSLVGTCLAGLVLNLKGYHVKTIILSNSNPIILFHDLILLYLSSSNYHPSM